MPPTEPEFTAPDGTIRKAYYGDGKQPWDTMKELGWAALFAASNVLKYVKRHNAKSGADDLKKARWYFTELGALSADAWKNLVVAPEAMVIQHQQGLDAEKAMDALLHGDILTEEEIALLKV